MHSTFPHFDAFTLHIMMRNTFIHKHLHIINANHQHLIAIANIAAFSCFSHTFSTSYELHATNIQVNFVHAFSL